MPWPEADSFVATSSFMGPLAAFQSKYKLLRELAAGSFGQVFVASRVADNCSLVVKVSRDEECAMEPFVMQSVDHPNIVKLLDAWASPVYTVLVMAHEGSTVGDILGGLPQRGGLPLAKDVCLFCSQLRAALRYLHGLSIMHRDIHGGSSQIARLG